MQQERSMSMQSVQPRQLLKLAPVLEIGDGHYHHAWDMRLPLVKPAMVNMGRSGTKPLMRNHLRVPDECEQQFYEHGPFCNECCQLGNRKAYREQSKKGHMLVAIIVYKYILTLTTCY